MDKVHVSNDIEDDALVGGCANALEDSSNQEYVVICSGGQADDGANDGQE